MIHDKFCRFSNPDRPQPKSEKWKVCFDCQRLAKARAEEREIVLKELK
jgi:hypothetical protein